MVREANGGGWFENWGEGGRRKKEGGRRRKKEVEEEEITVMSLAYYFDFDPASYLTDT